jgi:hypothetical protein
VAVVQLKAKLNMSSKRSLALLTSMFMPFVKFKKKCNSRVAEMITLTSILVMKIRCYLEWLE